MLNAYQSSAADHICRAAFLTFQHAETKMPAVDTEDAKTLRMWNWWAIGVAGRSCLSREGALQFALLCLAHSESCKADPSSAPEHRCCKILQICTNCGKVFLALVSGGLLVCSCALDFSSLSAYGKLLQHQKPICCLSNCHWLLQMVCLWLISPDIIS